MEIVIRETTTETNLKSKGDLSGTELIGQLELLVHLDCVYEPQWGEGCSGLGLFKADANAP